MDTRPARSPEEDALLRTATRRLPGGVLGGYYAPTDLQFHVLDFLLSGSAGTALVRTRGMSGTTSIVTTLGLTYRFIIQNRRVNLDRHALDQHHERELERLRLGLPATRGRGMKPPGEAA